MACNQTNLSTGTMSTPTPVNIQSASLSGNRRFMFSDNPETLNSSSFNLTRGTLWNDRVNTSSTTVAHRVLGWHVNNTGVPIRIGTTIQNLSSTNVIELTNVRSQKNSGTTGYLNIGLCIAKASMGQTMDSLTPVHNRIGVGSALMEGLSLPNGYFVGFMYEFNVTRYSGSGNLNYVIRTVATKDASDDLRSITTTPVAAYTAPGGSTHPRGSWSQSTIIGTTAAYNVGAIGTAQSYSISNGTTDNLFTASASVDPTLARNNPGHFGVNYIVRVPISNNTGGTARLRIRANPRGGTYAGAVFTGSAARGIPAMTTNTQVCHLMDYDAQPGSSTLEIPLMHAGAASTPVAIHISRI